MGAMASTPSPAEAKRSVAGSGRRADAAADMAPVGAEPGRRLLCVACGGAVTTESERIAVDGAHVHQRRNPYGFEFTFGCFRSASGARIEGPRTGEHTWFAGHAWAFSMCRGCSTHLGWHWTGGDGAGFHGLILDRLVAEGPDDA
jgi:hypothetical protein